MSASIAADPERVWRALTEPSECIRWDEHRIEAVSPPIDYPNPGQHICWRYQLSGVQLVMHDRPQAVITGRKLQSQLSVGSMRFEQTYTLNTDESTPTDPSRPRTLLGMKITAENSVPLMGAVVDRFEVRRMTVDRMDEALRSITKWCEANP